MENDATTVMLRNVRLGFPTLFVPKCFGNENDPAKATYSVICMIPKTDTASIDAVRAAMNAAYKATWPTNGPKLPADKVCLKDGDDTDPEPNHGHMLLSARSKKRPVVVGPNKAPLTEADGVIYGGCYGNVLVRIWAQDSTWGKRLNCSVEAVQFVKDGERFGSAPVSADVFDGVPGDGGSAGANPF